MKILCELKRFKEKVTRGRFAGNETEFAICVGGDNYSWNLNRNNLNATTPPIGQKYFKGFCHLLNYLSNFDINVPLAIVKITKALEENTGTKLSPEIVEKVATLTDVDTDFKEIGEDIDNHFRCNYNRVEHNSGKMTDTERIYIRVLGAKVGEKE